MPKKDTKSITLLVPVFNEEESIPLFIKRCDLVIEKIKKTQLPNAKVSYLFIDDGSFDKSVSIITELANKRKDIALVSFSRNFGKEAGLAAGLNYTTADAVVPMDVDLQDPPELLPQLIEKWIDGAEVVNAVRKKRDTDTIVKRLSARGFYKFYNMLADVPIKNDVGDYRLLDRVAIDALNRLPENVRFTKGLFSWVGFINADVEYERPERPLGETKWAYRRLWSLALDGIFSSTTRPLRIWSYIGAIVGLIALAYASIIILRTLIYGSDVPGYASLMVVILFLGGLNLFSLGIMGEYIGRISKEVRGRPLYIVRKTLNINNTPDDELKLPTKEKKPRAR